MAYHTPISIIIIIPLLIIFVDCGGYTYVPQSNENMPFSIKIVGVKYKSGEYQRFINQDAVYDQNREQIWGQVTGGKNIIIRLKELVSIKIEDFASEPSKIYSIEISKFKKLFEK
jgi:aminoglycoside N3'-acetyltransferase